jgi:hypothetical protein
MGSATDITLNILGSNAGALSSIASLTTLDATVKKNDASIKMLEKSYVDVSAAADKAFAAGDKKGATKAAREAAQIQSEIAKRGKENAAATAAAGSIASKNAATQSALQRSGIADKIKDAAVSAKSASQQRKDAIAQARDYASMVKIQRGLAEPAQKASGAWSAFAEKAKGAGGPVGSIVDKLETLGKGGAVGAAIAVAVALAAIAGAAVYAAVSLTKYAFASADAARSSRLFSEAALGSAAAGNELEQVVDQMSNLAPGLAVKLKDVGRSLADVNIRGRDAQRTLETFGLVATARGEQAAGAIKSIAESSRMANRLMLGPFNRITGQFTSLQGTGIKSSDVFASLAKVMGTSAEAAKKAASTGLVPFKKGLEAIELAARASLGGVVAKQATSLSTQLEKLKENVSRLFSGVAIDTFLAGLKTITDLFDQNTVTGYVLREVLTAVFTKVAEVVAKVFPYVKVAIQGVVFGMLLVVTAARKIYTAIASAFEGAGKNIDGLSLAFQIGAGAVGLVVGSIVGLAAAFVMLGTVAALATAPIWVPFAVAALAIYAAVSAGEALIDSVNEISGAIEEVDLGAAAGKMIDGLVAGIKSKIGDVTSAILDVSGAITGAFNSDQEIRSPGRKAMRGGKYVVQGYAGGMVQNVPMVERASLKVSNAANIPAGDGGSNGGNGGPVSLTVNVYGRDDAQEIGVRVREEVTLMLQGISRGNAVMV